VSDTPSLGPPPHPQPARIGFAGTPRFAATILKRLLQAGRRPCVVYTQPDRQAGRGRKMQPSAVKALALEHDIELRQPVSLRAPEEAAALAAFDLDVLVVAAYGLLLPPAILSVPRAGCINVHASLLPRWRGAAPIERAIMAGDIETGACIMQMDEGLDTGPVYLCERCPIEATMDAPALEARLADLGSNALLVCLNQLGDLVPVPQPNDGATYARKLTQADALIRWDRTAVDLHRQVRALTGRMPAFTSAGTTRVSILEAAMLDSPATPAAPGTVVAANSRGISVTCGSGLLNILRLQLNVGKGLPLSAADAVNGYARLFAVGAVLGDPTSSDPELL
jgi:methionyl-tRNA formyltransferase